jgi:predicted nucleotidyltransferase component of viral defense system
MIPANAVTAWGTTHAWPTREQVEQDLLLSRAICAIASDDYLSQELVFRGGTALHKLHLDNPTELGYTVSTRVSEHPKVYWRTTADSGVPLRIKIEVNTHERSPALPLTERPHRVDSSWWSGEANVRTFQPAELMATKIRALYQRSKGRDLFDLWLALERLHLEPSEILAAFGPYRPDGLTALKSRENLARKLVDPLFRTDLDPLVIYWPDDYDIHTAGALISDRLLDRLDS